MKFLIELETKKTHLNVTQKESPGLKCLNAISREFFIRKCEKLKRQLLKNAAVSNWLFWRTYSKRKYFCGEFNPLFCHIIVSELKLKNTTHLIRLQIIIILRYRKSSRIQIAILLLCFFFNHFTRGYH